MTLEFNNSNRHNFNRFSKLGAWYILALSVIATVSITGQVLIQRHLHSQQSDSHVVNLAGTQRYKSQWIVKMSMLIYTDIDHIHFPDKVNTLKKLLEEWKRGHYGLQRGDSALHLPGKNSDEVVAMFKEIEPFFQQMYNSATWLVKYGKKNNHGDSVAFQRAIKRLLDSETVFLKKMDEIVYQYDSEARSKVTMLSKLEYLLLAISIIVILLEIFFIFRPTAIQVNHTINQLIASEKNAKKMSKEIGALYTSLEKSYEELSHVNLPTESPKIYAKTDKGGNITFISDLFSALMGKELASDKIQLKSLFNGANLTDEWMDEVIESVVDTNSWQGTVRFQDKKGNERWTSLTIVPALNEQEEIQEWLVMGSDITLQKHAEKNMRAKSRAEIEKKINQQKFRSVLILEGQEEERKRLAMDIHDGIGQMLTSLKFQIESIDVNKNMVEVQAKLKEIQQLIVQVIKEVRRVTFNLKPTVLGDFGLQAAFNVFIREIGKLTDIELVYKNEVDAVLGLPQKIENNVFRIIQEAINNAIKYSEASSIVVSLRQVGNDLLIEVSDNGKGFDEELVEARSTNIESGRGFFNMYERTEYINGRLEIKSNLGGGTVVKLTLPIKTSVLA